MRADTCVAFCSRDCISCRRLRFCQDRRESCGIASHRARAWQGCITSSYCSMRVASMVLLSSHEFADWSLPTHLTKNSVRPERRRLPKTRSAVGNAATPCAMGLADGADLTAAVAQLGWYMTAGFATSTRSG